MFFATRFIGWDIQGAVAFRPVEMFCKAPPEQCVRGLRRLASMLVEFLG